jgi:hypothetical protein
MYRAQLSRAARPKTPFRKKDRKCLVCREPYRTLCVAKKMGGVGMPSSAYFRRQADICLRLSLIASDEEVSNRLITMSREYLAKSHALAGEADTQPAPADHGPGSPAGDIDPGEAGLGLSPQMQAPRLDP